MDNFKCLVRGEEHDAIIQKIISLMNKTLVKILALILPRCLFLIYESERKMSYVKFVIETL